MSLNAGSLGAFSARLATVNFLRAGKDSVGANAHLAISGSADILVSASTTFFTGDLKTKTGTLSSTSDAPSLTVSTALGHLYLNPADKVFLQKEVTSSQGTFSTSGVSMTLKSAVGNIAFSPASGSKVTVDAPFRTLNGLLESSGSCTHTTDAGDLTMSPFGDFVATRPFKTTNGNFSSTAPLNVSTTTGDISLQPAAGSSLATNAKLYTTDGRIESSVAASISTLAGDLTLNPTGAIVASKDLKLETGNVSSPVAMSLTTTAGNIALNPVSGSNVTTDAKLLTSNGQIQSTVAATVSTLAGNLTLDPFGELVLNKDTTLTTGKLTSGGTNDLVLDSGSGKVVINGNLDIQGTINAVNTTFIEVQDKTINLASSEVKSNTNADGSGIIIEGDAYGVSAAAKDLSLLWNNNSGSTPYWQLQGGDFYVTRKVASGAVVTYQFCIDDTQDLIIKKKVDAEAVAPVATFNV